MSDTAETGGRSPVGKWLREPLVHFAVLGLIVFMAHAAWQAAQARQERTIRISTAEIERLAAIWASEAGRPPADSDLQGIIASHAQEEVLMREAMRLGLDEGDTIIRRRLAQKMRFMMDDMAGGDAPGDDELRAYWEGHLEAYAEPPRRSFSHIFYSGEGAPDAARVAADKAVLAADDSAWRSRGDAFMLARSYTNSDHANASRLFGNNFADAVFLLDGEGWHGPMTSALGHHLVRVDRITNASQPPFETVRNDVLADYQDQARERANAEALAKMTRRYRIEVGE